MTGVITIIIITTMCHKDIQVYQGAPQKKKRINMWILFIIICVLINTGICQLTNTKYGPVRGHVVNLNDGRQVMSYLGIPYAKSTDGNRRYAVSHTVRTIFRQPLPLGDQDSLV